MISLAEHNLAVDQSQTRYNLISTIKRHFPNSRTIACTSEIDFPTTYKPGGCLQIVANTLQSRITFQGSDRFGRWTYIGLATKTNSMIVIITVYKPCKHTQTSGPLTVYRQQWTMLRKETTENPNPRKKFDSDFIAFVQSLQEKSHRIIIVGDFNETRNRSTLFQALHLMGLRDMILARHDNIPPFRSCNKGNNVIDYALCSSSLYPCIEASTYEPFMLHTSSDHRGIVIDFNTTKLLGRPDKIQAPDSRGINASNPVQVETFLKNLQTFWKRYNIDQRIQTAETIHSTTELREVLNNIDRDITRAMLQAERKVRKSQKPPWSPELKQASLSVKYYKLLLQQHRLKTNHSTAINHTLQQMEVQPPVPNSPQDYQTLLRKAQKKLKLIRRTAHELRTQHLETLFQRYAMLDDKKMRQVIKRIMRAEATKRCYRKLRWLTKPSKPGVTFVERTNTDGSTETLYDRQTVETAILERNKRHFNQCAGTPFTAGRLRKINWAADSKVADQILNGTILLTTISDDNRTQQVLQTSRQASPEISDHISVEDLKQLFRIWREGTTTSPSGRHLGIYKAIFNTADDTDDIICNNITTLINILVKNGIGLERWRNVTNMMIHKLDGSFHINKLRVIHLFEADYNGLIGILFNRRVLYHAEKLHVLNNNQWGGRPHRQAEDALMLKELTYNLAINTKTTLATFDNDATGCFDRVPCSVAMLASRRYGATKNMCRMQADTLRNIRHSLRTAFGTSLTSYTSTDDWEIHGQGQGSRAGPPTWVFVSALLLDCMNKHAHGLQFTCPQQQLHHQRTNDAFVDDVTGYTNKFVEELMGENVLDEVLQCMQTDATLWNDLLHISGGKLALHKCLYYVLTWRWKQKGATTIPANEIKPQIVLKDGQQSTPIQHHNSTTPHRTLGQFKSPAGNTSSQLAFMEKKSSTWLTAIKAAQLTKQEAQAAYEMMWFPSLSYGLGTTNLSYNELNNLQKPIINHILPQLGYNRHLPRAVVFGCPKFGGLNLKHLYIDQGTKHVVQFIKYYRNGGSLQNLIQISLRWLRLIAGFSYCPLLKPQPHYHHITDQWYKTMIRFLYECRASIETSDTIHIFSRVDDTSLMEDFLLTDPSPTILTELNNCRIFLRAITLSDICTSDGRYVTRQCWEGTHSLDSGILWPRQKKPPSKSWSIWRKYIMRCYLADESTTRKKREDLRLATALGPWLPNAPPHLKRPSYINPSSLKLYRHYNNIIQAFAPYHNTRTHLRYRPTGRVLSLPSSLVPIDCTILPAQPTHIVVQKHHLPSVPHRSPSIIHSFSDHINSLDLWEKHLLKHHQTDTGINAPNILSSRSIIVASDGSVCDDRGTFGWVIANPDGQILATGFGTAPGYKVTSFRSESYGILAALRFIYQLQCYLYYPLIDRNLTWFCDSQSLLQRIQSNIDDTHNPNRYKLADNDVETAIIQSFPLVLNTFHRRHIRSHQNDNIPLHLLPLPQRLNRIADNLATTAYSQIPQYNTHAPLISLARCQLRMACGTITRSYTKILHEAYMEHTTRQHLCHRLKLDNNTLDSIAWTEFNRAFQSSSHGHKRTIRKWLFGYLPTQRRLHRYKLSPSDLCPICQLHPETDTHFLTCGGSVSWQIQLFDPLEQFFHKSQIPQTFGTALVQQMHRYLNRQPPGLTVQSTIGTKAMFNGLFHQDWIALYNRQSTYPLGHVIISKIIRIILSAIVQRWRSRCLTLHQKNDNNNIETRTRLHHTIRALYSCRPYMLQQDTHILDTPLNQLLQQSTLALRVFVSQYKSLIKQSIQLQKEQTKRKHKDIATYFIRIR